MSEESRLSLSVVADDSIVDFLKRGATLHEPLFLASKSAEEIVLFALMPMCRIALKTRCGALLIGVEGLVAGLVIICLWIA